MQKILWIFGSVAGSAIGWWLGAKVGIMTGYVLSGLGAMAGVYLGIKLARSLQ